MGATFEPLDKIQNILYAIKELNELLYECDTPHEELYSSMIRALGIRLYDTIDEMKIGGADE